MKNRVFVVVVSLAFLAVMVGMSFANGNKDSVIMAVEPDNHICEPMSQGFWKRQCKDLRGREKKNHPKSTLFNLTLIEGYEGLCEDLLAKTKGDPCARADAQLAALQYNLDFEIVFGGCDAFEDDGTPTTVGAILDEIVELQTAGDPGDDTCKEIADLADCINSRDCFEDPYYVANLFDVEQNTFYKDIYAKISNWLNDILKSS